MKKCWLFNPHKWETIYQRLSENFYGTEIFSYRPMYRICQKCKKTYRIGKYSNELLTEDHFDVLLKKVKYDEIKGLNYIVLNRPTPPQQPPLRTVKR